MITRFIVGDFDENLLPNCINFLNDYHPSETDLLEIFIESNGGFSSLAEICSYLFNQHRHVVTVMSAYSAAFELLCLLDGPIKFFDFSVGMYHNNIIHAELEASKFTYLGKVQQYNAKIGNKRASKHVYPLLSEQEISDIEIGKDVYFNSKRMKEIFKDRLL